MQSDESRATSRIEDSTRIFALQFQRRKIAINAAFVAKSLDEEVVKTTTLVEFGTDHATTLFLKQMNGILDDNAAIYFFLFGQR